MTDTNYAHYVRQRVKPGGYVISEVDRLGNPQDLIDTFIYGILEDAKENLALYTTSENGNAPTTDHAIFALVPITELTNEPIESPVKSEAELHSSFACPGWEYGMTIGWRGGDAENPPKGDGWIRNVEAGWEGWERFQNYEKSYWRRPLQG